MSRATAIAWAFLVLAQTVYARVGAPPPAKSAPATMYSGRWFEIAQIAKRSAHPCLSATEDFAGGARGGLGVTLTCNQPSGRARQVKAGVTIVPGSGNARFRMSFFGGLIHQEYWLLDYAADQSWALMATPGGNYLWLLSRRPTLDETARAAAGARIRALGYDLSRLTPTQ